MSSYRALAAASRSLRNLLRDRMEEPVAVTVAPPDVRITGLDGRRVNLYLAEVREVAGLANQIPPAQARAGGQAAVPLSLELSYLVTAFAANDAAEDGDLDAQGILGDVMRVLRDFPVIDRSMHTGDDPAQPTILDEPLLAAPEPLRVSLLPAGLDDFAKIWSSLPETNLRRSLLYRVSLVQISSQRPVRVGPPVKTVRALISVRRNPEIVAVFRAGDPTGGDGRVPVGGTLVLIGRDLGAPPGARTRVKLGQLDPIGVVPLSSERIEIAVPDALYPVDPDHGSTRPIATADQLAAGIHEVAVEVEMARPEGAPPATDQATRRFHGSNRAAFMLTPAVTGVSPASGASGGILRVTGTRLYRSTAETLVLVGDAAITVRPPLAGESFAAPTAAAVEVPLVSLARLFPVPPPAGRVYPVRVLANGGLNIEETFTFTLMP